MNRTPLTASALFLCAIALFPAAAQARSGDLWATVNVCDTRSSPDQMGVRARMPGDGTRERMYMRFRAQFRSGETWKPVSGKGISPWLLAGSALFRHEELGYTFSFDKPRAGTGYTMRGLVQFEWRARRRHNGRLRTVVVRRSHAYTTGGHRSRGADPKNFTAATCRIATPGARSGS
jgi:hypothetical protein